MKLRTLILGCLALTAASAMADELVKIQTDNVDLILKVKDDGRLTQAYLGKTLRDTNDLGWLEDGREAYITHGPEVYFEPALDVIHADGNPSSFLRHTSHATTSPKAGVQETVITLEDQKEPLTVRLHYVAYTRENVIKTWTEIVNRQKKPIQLKKFASSMLHFYRPAYYLTQFNGDWINEAQMTTLPLAFGKKVLESNLGSRADMFASPQFILSLSQPATETSGDVLLGQLGWTGNFRFTFEVDREGWLRVISGINNEFSERTLQPGETFQTADFFFTLSSAGLEKASHDLHDWARRHQVKDGMGDRMTLLNNWEATYFDFNEDKLVGLMDDAVRLGVDMFLLDDGWFGNKYPRSNDDAALGDWQETAGKLPNGVGRLCDAAREKGIKFGIWIEPEMVSQRSELFEKHRDWVLMFPNRDPQEFRNQLTLDLSNPKVQDFVFGVVDGLMTKYPEIAFFKWDCNSPIMNPYSPYLKDHQTHLYVDYVRGLYSVLERIKAKYPELPMMMCAGGSGRIDYKGLEYFTEFWASDDTDPAERLFIQYGYSFFYPSKTICAHVTTWNKLASVKFRTDVASMGKLGFDIKLSDMTADDIAYAREAVRNYNRLKPVILDGDLYRLVAPYQSTHAASAYVSKDKGHAVLFTFDIQPRAVEHRHNVVLRGLDSNRRYRIQEINLMPGQDTWVKNRSYSGDYLMNIGLDLFTGNKLNSRVVELIAE
ncbi:MAG: alpha-galactosidase [Bacteroidaceae bacterium]|nr:alpha-galactosidase [Bacteroidaceae bacterium]